MILSGDDRYRDWDAAYVLGSLSPAESLEYEQHLSTCAECRGAIAELAGMPGLLSTLSTEEAFALSGPDPALDNPAARSPNLLPQLVLRTRRHRRRSRLVAFGVGATTIGAAIVVTLIVTFAALPSGAGAPATDPPGGAALVSEVHFIAEVPSPLSAVATFEDEPWGTRIEWKCTYEQAGATAGAPGSSGAAGETPYGSPPPSASAAAAARGYAMVVTDKAGTSTQVATWSSGPGSVATPTATTSIRRADIASVTIVAADSGQVLLKSQF